MRGGRFQQKTTEDANMRNAEALFESRTVVEIREVEAHTRKEIEEKKEELRQHVGESYRDLIESADSIVSMKNSCQNVSTNFRKMENGFRYLNDSISVQQAAPDFGNEKKRREKLYGIGSRVKYVVDTPEQIWGCLDEHMYLEGAQRYLRAREVHTLLTEAEVKGEKKELLAHFPLLKHQWPLVETFRGQISQRSRDRLFEQGLGAQEYAVALAAVAVIDELNPYQIISLFLETRRAWLKSCLRSAIAGGDRVGRGKKGAKKEENYQIESTELANVATVLSKAANMMQVSLCQVGELFLEVHGDMPLFFKTVLNSPPGSQLFGTIPNPEEEVHFWKLHWEKLENTMAPLPAEFISEACMSWIRTCEEDVGVEGKAVLDLVEQCKDLAGIEHLVRETLDSHAALEGSMEWLQGAFGQAINSPWHCVSSLLLKEPINLWDILFERTFVKRAEAIIDSGLAQIDIESMLDDYLSVIGVSCGERLQDGNRGLHGDNYSFQILGLGYLNSGWLVGMQQDPILPESTENLTGFPFKLQKNDKQRLRVSNSYLGGEIAHLKEYIDQKLGALFEDVMCFLQVHQGPSRLDNVAPYLQEQCFIHISSIVRKLQDRLVDLSEEINRLAGTAGKFSNILKSPLEYLHIAGSNKKATDLEEADEQHATASVEKALFLGRLFVALADHSLCLPAILQSSKLWSFEDKSMTGVGLRVLPSPYCRNSWLDAEHNVESPGRWVLKTKVSGAVEMKDKEMALFSRLQSVLRVSNLVAHGMWVSWSTEELSALLARDMRKDEDLMSSTPLKGWEETAMKQEIEDGGEIEVKLHLPAIPSPYVISFLFRSCQEIYRIGGHVLDKTILQFFSWKLLEKVLTVYETACSDLKFFKSQVSESGLLQLLFDLHFLGDVLSGGQHVGFISLDLLKEDHILELLPTPLEARMKQLLFQKDTASHAMKKSLQSLLDKLSSGLDPIDWATYEPHLWENERQAYQHFAVLFGFLVQLDRLYTDTLQKLSSNADSSILKVSATVSRFTYLPISTPSMLRRITSSDESAGNLWKTYSNGELSSKFTFDEESNFGSTLGARPLFRSIITQVGSKFGEGTFKLGSMLSDGQVSRLKDRSAAAMSTFGEILPAQAAGLFSSLTAGATKLET